MNYLGLSCESRGEGRTDEAKTHGILPLKRRQRDAASPIETKRHNWLGDIQAVEQAPSE